MISCFTTMTDPLRRGDPILEAVDCYADLADEIVIVDGGTNPSVYQMIAAKVNKRATLKFVQSKWPKEFDWPLIGQQFQKGYQECTGDWVLHCDLDFFFHERDMGAIKRTLEGSQTPAMSFYKRQFIQPDRFNLKSRLVIAVNKGVYGDRIRFDGGRDLCQPTLVGEDLSPDVVVESGIPFYNLEKLSKTEAQIKEDVGRMARAWQRYYGEYKLGGPDDESAYAKWLEMVTGRFRKPQEVISLDDLPKYVKPMVRALTPLQWGGGGFGQL